MTKKKDKIDNFPDINKSKLRNYLNKYKKIKFDKDGTPMIRLPDSDDSAIPELKWLYELMCDKIVKGIAPTIKDRKKLKNIEKIIGLR